jgi:hypothetical protein
MKNIFWIIFFTVIFSAFSFLYAHNKGYCETTVEGALDAARNVRSQVDGKEKLNSRLNVPATSDTIQMETFGTHEKFDATIMCPGAGPVISVQMLPEDSLAGSGEVKLIGSYDLNQDGNFDQTVQARHVGGICGDGFIANCSPRGSFNDCEYYKWMYEDGMIVAKNKIQVSEDEPLRDVVLVDLHGCFCFNRSCSNAILGNVDQVLTYFASGIKDIMRQNNQDFVITKVDLNPAMMTLDYIGANISDCNTNLDSVSQDKTVQELSSLDSSLGFGEESAVELALSDLGDPFTVLSNSVGQTHVTRQCTIEADVSTTGEMVNVVRKMEDINFYVAQDEHESEVCFSVTPQNSLIEAYGNMGWEECVARQIPSELDNICLHASAGYFSQIIETENEEALSGYISVWGQRHPLCGSMGIADCAFQRWKVDCKGIHATDSFQCYSPSMSLENGETIYNDPFNEHLYQGCTIVKPPKNNCVALEANPDCELKDEIIDGVQTVKDGVRTNLNPMRSCRTFSGVDRAITVCETGWETTRTYTCVTDSNFDFSKEMERADHIDQNLVYNKNSGDWSSQGDIRFDENGVRTEVVFDPDLQFNTKMESCEPACLVSYDAPNTGITLDGEEIVTSNATKEIYESRLCEKTGNSYVCPRKSGERLETGCTCFDENAFVEAIAELTTIKESSLDMICSSGEKQGVCNPDDEGVETKFVACVANPHVDEQGEFQGDYLECLPQMWWRKSPLQNQRHRIYATEDYHCQAEFPGFAKNQEDYFDNDLGALIPESLWFNFPVNWAKPLIVEHLETDPNFIPDPGPECPCIGSDSNTSTHSDEINTYECKWTTQTSVDHINRRDVLALEHESENPFGRVELFFRNTGSWDVNISGICNLVESAVRECARVNTEKYYCAGNGVNYPNQDACLDNCKPGCTATTPPDQVLRNVYYNDFGKQQTKYHMNVYTFFTYTIPKGVRWVNIAGTMQWYHFWGYWGSGIRSGHRVLIDGMQVAAAAWCTSTSCGTGPGFNFSFNVDPSRAHTLEFQSRELEYGGSHACYINVSYLHLKYGAQYLCGANGKTYSDYNSCANKCPYGSSYNTLSQCNANCQDTCYEMPEASEYVIVSDTYTRGVDNCKINYTCSAATINKTSCPEGYEDMGTYDLIAILPVSCYCKSSGGVKRTCTDHDLAVKTMCVKDGKMKYICGNNKYQCQNIEAFMCSNGQKYNTLRKCNEMCSDTSIKYTCSLDSSKTYSSLEACKADCMYEFACNAQSEDYKFEVTIKNPGTNEYSQELDLVEPENRHIDSAPYTHESLILQQCIDRYMTKTINFDDAETGYHFEHKPADYLIYAASSIVRGELPVDPEGEKYPGRLPKIPPVYTATYAE